LAGWLAVCGLAGTADLFWGFGLGGTGTRNGFLGFFAFLGLMRLFAAAAARC
jgi:hypothetical protein